MLVYIIDAFNLIHKLDSLKKSLSPHRELIHFIRNNRLTGSRHNRVIIVFDGKPDPQVLAEEFHYEIVFSYPHSADDIIKRRLSEMSRTSEVVVISDDRAVQGAAKALGARIMKNVEFVKIDNLKQKQTGKDISYSLQREITEELRKIWLKEE